MLQDVNASIIGEYGDFRASVTVPNEIAQSQREHLERNSDRLGLRVRTEGVIDHRDVATGTDRQVRSAAQISPRNGIAPSRQPKHGSTDET